jgi:hypothetical protein
VLPGMTTATETARMWSIAGCVMAMAVAGCVRLVLFKIACPYPFGLFTYPWIGPGMMGKSPLHYFPTTRGTSPLFCSFFFSLSFFFSRGREWG